MAYMSNLGLLYAAYKAAKGKPLNKNEQFFMDLYSTELSNIISRGRIIPLSSLDYSEVQLAYNFLGTSNTKRKLYCITKFSLDYDGNISTDIKEAIQRDYPMLKVITQLTERPFPYRTDTKQFVTQSANATKQYNMFSKFFKSLPEDVQERGHRMGSKVINRPFIDNLYDNYRSFQYVNSMVRYNRLSLTYCFVHVIMPEYIMDGDNKVDTEEAVFKIINEYALQKNILVKEVKTIDDYLTDFSPIGFQRFKGTFTNMNANLFGPPNFSKHVDLTQGIEGTAGIDYGILLSNNTPFLLDLKSSSSAQVMMVTGQAGSGKSNLVKGAVEAHILQKDYLDICDYKGVDYAGIKELYAEQTHILDMYSGVYPNLLNMTGIPNADENTRNDMVDCTIDIMMALLELQPKQVDEYYSDLTKLLRTLLINYMLSLGVTTDPKTLNKTAKANYYSFWSYASEQLTNSKVLKEKYGTKPIKLLHDTLYEYFAYEGTLKYFFKQEINVADILTKQVVIYAFKGINRDKKDLNATLSFLYMSSISLMRNSYIKSQKRMQVLIYEELQEASNDLSLLKTVAKRATVSRSANVTMYTVFNNVEMFRETDSAEVNKALSSLRACYTSYFIGYMEDGNTEFVKKAFRLEEIEPYIDAINNSKTAKANKYNFAVKYNTGNKKGSGMIRQILPKQYTDNALYTTRKIVDDVQAS